MLRRPPRSTRTYTLFTYPERCRSVESSDQQPGVLIDVQAERPAHAAHAVFAQPGLGGGEQGVENGRVVGRFEKTEEPGLVVMLIQMQLINLRTDSANRLVVAVGDPELPLRVLGQWLRARQRFTSFKT